MLLLATLWYMKKGQAKGQIKPYTDWRAVDSPKKRTNEFGFFFAFSLFTAKKPHKFVRSFFWENLRCTNLLTVLSDLQSIFYPYIFRMECLISVQCVTRASPVVKDFIFFFPLTSFLRAETTVIFVRVMNFFVIKRT